MRLGDFDALKEDFADMRDGQPIFSDSEMLSTKDIAKIIDNAPTVEPKKEIVPFCKVTFDKEQLQEIVDKKVAEMIERTQGEWIGKEEYDDYPNKTVCECSECGKMICISHNDFPNFCENCGADMRKGGAE